MWIAKDRDGEYTIFENKPENQDGIWVVDSGYYFGIPHNSVDRELQNCYDEPIKIEIKRD